MFEAWRDPGWGLDFLRLRSQGAVPRRRGYFLGAAPGAGVGAAAAGAGAAGGSRALVKRNSAISFSRTTPHLGVVSRSAPLSFFSSPPSPRPTHGSPPRA